LQIIIANYFALQKMRCTLRLYY